MHERYGKCRTEPFGSLGIRIMPVDNFSVFYRVDKTSAVIEVIRIVYGKRDIEPLLSFELHEAP